MSYEQNFYIVPMHIRKLSGITLALLDIYETIFQFWNHGKPCFLSNKMIMERTGILSERTVQEAFLYYEKHGVLERRIVNGKRFLVQPERKVELIDEKENKNQTLPPPAKLPEKLSTPPALECAPPPQSTAPPPRTGVRHNINNLNLKNNNKSSYSFDQKVAEQRKQKNEKKHEWADRSKNSHSRNEMHSTVKFYEPGNPDYDRVYGTTKA